MRFLTLVSAGFCILGLIGCGGSEDDPTIVGIWKTIGVNEHFELTEDGTLHLYDKITDPPTMTGSYGVSDAGTLTWILTPEGGREYRDAFDYDFPEDEDHLALRSKGDMNSNGTRIRPWKTFERVER